MVLEQAGITTNKKMVPFDSRGPLVTSGIRIGTPALTTRGMGENEMIKIANWISQLIDNPDSTSLIESIHKDVVSLCKEFPLYEDKNEMHELSA